MDDFEKDLPEVSVEETEVQEIKHPDYKSEIVAEVRSNLSPKLLREHIYDYHENDIADALPLLSREERSKLFGILDSETLSDILEYTEDIEHYFSELSVRKKVEILSHLETDTAIEYLRTLEKGERSILIDLMDDEVKREIALIGSFDEDEIGSRMTTNYIAITDVTMSVRQAMRELIDQASENDNISTIYVLDADRTFYGAISLKDLIITREGTELDSIVMTSFPYVYAYEQIGECIERIKDYSEDSIPVLDSANRLLGVLTSQTIVELTEEEMGDDYAKLAGLLAEEDLNEPIKKSMSKRLPWLLVLLVLGMLVSSVVGLFDKVVQGLTILVSFQSIVLGMSGNVGTQSLAVTIRVLMDESLTAKQKRQLVFKEVRVGLCNGVVLAVAACVLIGFYILLVRRNSLPVPHTPWMAFAISGCTGASLILSMMLSSLSGTCIPIVFKKIGVDPAVASGPLITTLNDLMAVVAYYGLAWIFLMGILKLA